MLWQQRIRVTTGRSCWQIGLNNGCAAGPQGEPDKGESSNEVRGRVHDLL
ncbi:hypothetical protein Rahaq2_3668 [Rahnella aquatilis CIP 78.65 = ATCC 33071]|uniref:Uncharacterized protein n=1 Tax=Rahnella aquatilis (strain ATCC 33071 / DSM 4594 / JCM 1683 / NBRC 105701 / NCIMB 13365 / CIP 78.65) TaxID=745277 RepID=H2IPE8_RAHAC|nr:hypothetical protein Rahaq2_3668 [Rahnella aquatilis CIP 78.65 = ATCC 33071]